MKRKLLFVTALLFLATIPYLVYHFVGSGDPALAAPTNIAGTAHNFYANTAKNPWAASQICQPCHTPHNAITGLDAPLWSHTLTTATYTLYSSSTLNASISQPTGRSLLCLSCHDGTVALGAYIGTGDNSLGNIASGYDNPATGYSPYLGTDLRNDHPVSFTYDAALATADSALVTPSSASWVDANQTIPLFAGMMHCATCHNPHGTLSGGSQVPHMLRKSNAGSALCLTCHLK